MTYDVLGPGPLDYLPCRYGASRLLFRGPKRSLDVPYVAFLGPTETYGRFIEHPFPELVEQQLGIQCVNFGQLNAGIDVFAHDPFVIDAANGARVTVIQVMGAQNMTNRFYSVHPRRNDRFVAPSTLLKTIYSEVDFADFHFNKHMLLELLACSPERFQTVRQELRQAWIARIRLMLQRISGKTILLWLAPHAPDQREDLSAFGLGNDPLLVTRSMIEEVRGDATYVVEVVPSLSALEAGTEGMIFSEMEASAAEQTMGPLVHREAAAALSAVIKDAL